MFLSPLQFISYCPTVRRTGVIDSEIREWRRIKQKYFIDPKQQKQKKKKKIPLNADIIPLMTKCVPGILNNILNTEYYIRIINVKVKVSSYNQKPNIVHFDTALCLMPYASWNNIRTKEGTPKGLINYF